MQNKSIVLVLSHCLLNPKVRAKELSQHPEIKDKVLKLACKYNARIEHLPCPEFLFFGEREPKTYDEYLEIEGFKDSCEKLAEDIINNFEKYDNSYIVVIGIARSPSCAVSQVYGRKNNLKKGKGMLIYFLHKKMSGNTVFTEIDYHKIDVSMRKIEEILKTICPLSTQFRRSRET